MSPPMKGLVQFIADIRNAKVHEEEEKRVQAELVNIQKQFSSGNLSGYQRKKYICKLMYIYMLGHRIKFGYREAIELISSQVFSEKQIGYMAALLFVSGNREVDGALIEHVRHDLAVDNSNFNALALQFLSCSAEFGQLGASFENDVFNLLRSPLTPALVRKKACLTMLALYRADPQTLSRNPGWVPRIVALIDDQNLGVAISAVSLTQFIARIDPILCKPAVPLVIGRLHRLVVNRECPDEYLYYGNPAPWLTVKLMGLLEDLIPDPTETPLDPANGAVLGEVLSSTLSSTKLAPATYHESLEYRNTRHSILFAAVSLSSRVDASPEGLPNVIRALGGLLEAGETNARYLALDALTKVAARSGASGSQKAVEHLPKVMRLLRDRDVSVRQKALDLVYAICDSTSVENICRDLLAYMGVAEYSMRPDVAVKVAVLAEKFATDATWYVTTALKLIAVAGSHVADEVWQRIVQIVVNNEGIQPLACKTLVRHLKAPSYPEPMLKVGAFLLGEYGHLIESSASPKEQFDLVYAKFYQCSFASRAMILSCFLKFFLKYEELRPLILDVFESESASIDSEIQQRALEYLKIVTRNDGLSLLKIVTVGMPSFTNKTSPLIARLGSVKIFEKGYSKVPDSLKRDITGISSSASAVPPPAPHPRKGAPAPPPPRNHAASSATLQSLPRSFSSQDVILPQSTSGSSNPFDRSRTASPTKGLAALSPNWEEGYTRLLRFDQGVFFENSLLKIIYRLTRETNSLSGDLQVVNKSPSQITGLVMEIRPGFLNSDDPPYMINVTKVPDAFVPENGRTRLQFQATIRTEFGDSEAPVLNLSFVSGGFSTIRLRLPVVLAKAVAHAPLERSSFFSRWGQIGSALGAEGESQLIFKTTTAFSVQNSSRILSQLGFAVVDNADPNPNNVVGAGILHTATGVSGCLCRLEIAPDGQQFRLTMRCTRPRVAGIILSTAVSVFKQT
ncbi:unnamed protein product [Kuraishia capsulata CBS 1993]|uniref:AP-2 complex subunit alpha n=1 Tax=Kuraishia capsulata CBS 1993 TaxID=1382522 RepID=W6MUQ9_9ASCO|nr:uncharacterized protein KUCA_T00001810001 [Kuraishia capsulata CBS 1993]CDK25840.1 unnamed protein product [Kuraishia capsulata CBS 1993]